MTFFVISHLFFVLSLETDKYKNMELFLENPLFTNDQ